MLLYTLFTLFGSTTDLSEYGSPEAEYHTTSEYMIAGTGDIQVTVWRRADPTTTRSCHAVGTLCALLNASVHVSRRSVGMLACLCTKIRGVYDRIE